MRTPLGHRIKWSDAEYEQVFGSYKGLLVETVGNIFRRVCGDASVHEDEKLKMMYIGDSDIGLALAYALAKAVVERRKFGKIEGFKVKSTTLAPSLDKESMQADFRRASETIAENLLYRMPLGLTEPTILSLQNAIHDELREFIDGLPTNLKKSIGTHFAAKKYKVAANLPKQERKSDDEYIIVNMPEPLT